MKFYFIDKQTVQFSDCADARADLEIRCPHMSEDPISRDASPIRQHTEIMAKLISSCRGAVEVYL